MLVPNLNMQQNPTNKLFKLVERFRSVPCCRFIRNARPRFPHFKHVRRKLWTYGKPLQLLALMFSGYIIGSYLDLRRKISNLSPTMRAATTLLLGRRDRFNFIADVVDVAAPCVVYIEIRDTQKLPKSKKPGAISNGSGFIVDSDGLILTNAHVVIDKALRANINLVVRLQDGRTFDGIVESIDHVSDLATVRIKCTGLPTMRLGYSDSLKSGEWVVALGSPLALSNTVTCGIISAYRKSIEIGLKGNERSSFYIQTDAAINDGNSGGPLMNLDGEAIGINCLKVLPGISFAIPIDHVKKFLMEHKAKSSRTYNIKRATETPRYAGMTMLSLSEDLIVALQNKRKFPDVKTGVMVWKVVQESPAEK